MPVYLANNIIYSGDVCDSIYEECFFIVRGKSVQNLDKYLPSVFRICDLDMPHI